MPTARELLEQADALMRRNRANALDDIPVLTEAMPAVAFTQAPRAAPPPVDPGPPSVPLLTENVDVIDDDATLGPEAVEGEPSAWLEFADENPSVIGDAPDSIAIVPPVEMRGAPPDEALLASAEHEEIEFTLPAEEISAAEVTDSMPALESTDAKDDGAEGVFEGALEERFEDRPEGALVDDAEDAIEDGANAAAPVEAATAAAIEADADHAVVADFSAVDAADAGATAAAGYEAAAEVGLDTADIADAGAAIQEAYAAAPVEAPPGAVTMAPAWPATVLPPVSPLAPVAPSPPVVTAGVVELAAAAPLVAAAVATPVVAPAAPSMADDDERWVAAAEEIRMQVLQRIDLFTDTGLRDQLTQRLQPIADRASADFVKAINLHVGDLLRTYVAEAIEREIERWRRDH